MDYLTALLALLLDVPAIRSASIDPADLGSLPGAWVQLRGLDNPTLDASMVLTVQVSLIVEDTDGGARAAQALIDLYAAVVPGVLTPDGAVTFAGVQLPSNPTAPLPAITFPVDIPANATQEASNA